ncbi:aldo/keto reductase [Corallococcus coralloides DSM 2259]|uniref:Aldo/keto reductase n=1 Tax=Corallococcus coralloides (strain ATCC 25202 / DSM 2259 / NBRC 100086 / M2) TaxID=1144275 RepID=H8MER9_CORCM|nr:aldo/keto reductase [Corallococcus coralloides]AFE10706.1 aldo/keto reductase [Corallococcus coralloides DSM 2259]
MTTTSLPRFTPRRALGRTGFTATAVGIGDLADRTVPREELVATLARALDAGLNVIDTAPGYEDGLSEEVVGEALRGRREGVFVIDKVDALDAPVAPQVEASLRRLGLPSVDLFALHAVKSLSQWEELARPGGALEQLEACVAKGQARFKGISCHHPDALVAAVRSRRCDVVMFPLGPFVDARYVEEVLPLARAHGVGVVSFKTFGAGKLLGDTEGYGRPLQARPRGKVSSGGEARDTPVLPHLSVAECVQYTLTLEPDVMLMGMGFPNEQDAALRAAAVFQPLDAAGMQAVRERAHAAIQGKGAVWWNPPSPDVAAG